MRILLCGTNYGSTYLRALYANESGFVLSGILGRSERSREMAAQCGVPFFTNARDAEGDAACVAISGEAGRGIIDTLLERGIHVLAEHPAYVEDITRHRRHRAVYHVNAHYSDIDAAAGFVKAFRAARVRAKPLFLTLMTNPRTLYSAIEIAGRALGKLEPKTLTWMPSASGAFFRIAEVQLGDVPLTIQMQMQTAAVDDGSANWVSHNFTAGFDDGVLSLAEASGPLSWMPAPPSVPQLQSEEGAAFWSRPLWRVLATPPPTFGDYAGWARDNANRVALGRFAASIRTDITPPEQSDEHLLGVSALWEMLLGRS